MIFGLSLALISCKKSSSEAETYSIHSVAFTVGGVSSRVSGSSFDLDDAISVGAYDGDDLLKSTTYKYIGSSSFSSDAPISYVGSEAKSLSYVAVYPSMGSFAKEFSFAVSADQSTVEAVEASDLLVAQVGATTELTPELLFLHSMSSAMLRVSITRDGVASDEVPTITFHAKSVAQCNLADDSFVASGDVGDITPMVSGSLYSAIIAPQSILSGTTLATMSVSGETFTFSRDLEMTFKPGEYLLYDWAVDLVTGTQTISQVGGSIQDWANGADDSANDGGSSGDSNLQTLSVGYSQLGDRSAVVSWDNSGERSFDIELFKGGVSLRKYDALDVSESDAISYASSAWRFVFAGLDPSTQYEATITTDTSSGSVTFTTTASPDESAYLICADFDEHPWGGYPIYNAFGVDASGGYLQPTTMLGSVVTGAGFDASTYHATYLAQWGDYVTANYMTEVYLGAGVMMVGGVGTAGMLTLPPLALSSATNAILTFDAAPYVEPNSATGSWESEPNVLEGTSFTMSISGGGSIHLIDNAQYVSGGSIVNNSPSEQSADSSGHMSMTTHTVYLLSITADTKISITTTAASPRMLVDNIKFKTL